MKKQFIDKEFAYDGSQLRSLFAYMNFGLQGDSIVSWAGPCDIPAENIIDGEDLRKEAKICGSKMLHFIVELFDVQLVTGVAVQRLMAAEVARRVLLKAPQGSAVERRGDDVYLVGEQDFKLNISIATQSPVSTLVHFALNISNEGTPVPTASLEDFGISTNDFANEILEFVSSEVSSMKAATQKVRGAH